MDILSHLDLCYYITITSRKERITALRLVFCMAYYLLQHGTCVGQSGCNRCPRRCDKVPSSG